MKRSELEKLATGTVLTYTSPRTWKRGDVVLMKVHPDMVLVGAAGEEDRPALWFSVEPEDVQLG